MSHPRKPTSPIAEGSVARSTGLTSTARMSPAAAHPWPTSVHVSVIVPLHNSATFAPRTVALIVAALRDNDEVILVDDASSDDTLARLQPWVQDPRVSLVALTNNLGASGARRAGLERARRDYVWFCDSDDLPSLEIISRMTARAEETKADIVTCCMDVTNTEGQVVGRLGLEQSITLSSTEGMELLFRGILQGHLPNKLIRRSLLISQAPVPAVETHEDLLMMLGLVRSAETVATMPDVLYTYLRRPGSLLHRQGKSQEGLVAVGRQVRAMEDAGLLIDLEPDLVRSFLYRSVFLEGVHEAARSMKAPDPRLAEFGPGRLADVLGVREQFSRSALLALLLARLTPAAHRFLYRLLRKVSRRAVRAV
jgi:hypothetical protein